MKRSAKPQLATEATKPTGLNKNQFARLWAAHEKTFFWRIFEEIHRDDCANKKDVAGEILSIALVNAYEHRNEYDNRWTFFTWMRPRLLHAVIDYFRKVTHKYEKRDFNEYTTGESEDEDTSDCNEGYHSNKQEHFDWVNPVNVNILDSHACELTRPAKKIRKDDYLKHRLESLLTIKDLRNYRATHPEYILPDALDLLPDISNLDLDLIISIAKHEPRDKIALKLGVPINTINKRISRVLRRKSQNRSLIGSKFAHIVRGENKKRLDPIGLRRMIEGAMEDRDLSNCTSGSLPIGEHLRSKTGFSDAKLCGSIDISGICTKFHTELAKSDRKRADALKAFFMEWTGTKWINGKPLRKFAAGQRAKLLADLNELNDRLEWGMLMSGHSVCYTALFAGETVEDARMVGVTADPEAICMVAKCAIQDLGTPCDPVRKLVVAGRRKALEVAKRRYTRART